LGGHGRQYAAVLTYAALDPTADYLAQEFQAAFGALPQEGLQEAAQALLQAIEGAGKLREDYWKNRIRPFWQHIWPKSRDLMSERIAESLVRLSIAARGEFPDALATVRDWLLPVEHPYHVVHPLHEFGLAKRFPEETLILLDAVFDKQPWAPRELQQFLQEVAEAAPGLAQDPRHQRLLQYSRQHGV